MAKKAAAPVDDDRWEAVFQLAAGLVNASIIAEMCMDAGIYRTQVDIGKDSDRGLLRMVRVCGIYRMTTIEEAQRYVTWLVARNKKPRRRPRSASAREFADRLAAQEDRAA